MIKIGINGFGRIGRLVLRAVENYPSVEVVATNGTADEKTTAHLFKYDSVHNTFDGTVEAGKGSIIVNGKEVKLFTEREPADIDWNSVGAEIVIDSTGLFTEAELAKAHLGGSVKKVILSSPGKNEDITVVLGVNEEKYDKNNHHIISNASCTTNCLAPVAKVLNEKFGVIRGVMTTIHSYTNDQKILDKRHKDLRRARAAALSMIPTSTGAAKAVGLVLPELKGKLNGMSMRVPTPNVSIVDLVVELNKSVTKEEVNKAFKDASENELKGILGYSDEPLVSHDFNGNPLSSIIDSDLTMVMEDNMVKVFSWYDNEMGYATRCVDLAVYIAKQGL